MDLLQQKRTSFLKDGDKAHTALEKDAQRCQGFTRNLSQITNGL